MSDRLTAATLGRLGIEHRPLLDPSTLEIGVVHLGLGAFHRAHQLAFIEDAAATSGESSWGVCAFSQRSPVAAQTLAEQDGLYSLRVASGSGTGSGSGLKVMASLREARFAGAGGVTERLADPRVRLASLTVTEKGYRHDPATGRLRRLDRDVQADVALLASCAGPGEGAASGPHRRGFAASAAPARTVVGQLALGLAARCALDAGPLTVLCCDNLPANGRLLAGLVGEMAALAGASQLATWMAGSVSFPCSMVDRIVPAPRPGDRAAAEQELGLADAAAVVTEPFRQWVLEDRFAGARPAALESVGVELVADVAAHERLKLRMLNGAHSALAYLGLLAGHELISTAVADEAIAGLVVTMLDSEVAPFLDPPPGADVAAYRDRVLERFANPLLEHRCSQVGNDGSQKLPQRLLATVVANLAAGVEPRRAALVVAAWVRLLVLGAVAAPRAVELSDPVAGELRRLAGNDTTPAGLAAAALLLSSVFGEALAGDARFRRLLAEALSDLAAGPVAEVAADYAGRSGR